jgi:hypothetical protein
MPRILIRPIRGRAARLDFDTILAEVGAEMDSTVKPALVEEHAKIVADWAHRPEFKARKVMTKEMIAIDVWASGDPENVKIWRYVNEGTVEHDIPKTPRPYPLGFHWDGPGSYKPKTAVGGGYGGPGVATGPKVHFWKVHHPGNDARDFEKHIAGKMRTWFTRRIEAAFKRGVRKAWKG